MQTFEILLISKSPRRRQILEEAGLKFAVDTVKVSESFEKNVNVLDAVKGVAESKARAYLDHHKPLKLNNKLIVSADTIVVHAEHILGKPKNPDQAVEYLRAMSGDQHDVITAVFALNSNTGEFFSFAEITKVEFLDLSDQQILEYVASGEPMDKAGAYGIQGAAKDFVKNYEGSFLNVVGFPIERFLEELKNRGWHVTTA